VTVSILLAFAAGACTTSVGGAPAPKLPFTERHDPVGPVPEGLDEFYSQELTWEGCADYGKTDYDREALLGDDLQCTHLSVPLDYAKPAGDTIRLGVLRRPAKQRDQRIGALVINPGGPGAAGLSTAAALADVNDTLADRFDFVGFDPRGVGSSEPTVECLTDEEMDEERADDDELDVSPQGVEKLDEESKEYGQKCVENTEHGAAMLANIGTRDVARDLDILRSALGDEKLTYLGYSYGTRRTCARWSSTARSTRRRRPSRRLSRRARASRRRSTTSWRGASRRTTARWGGTRARRSGSSTTSSARWVTARWRWATAGASPTRTRPPVSCRRCTRSSCGSR
jgi:pimeloyl-ACP methyl ester carboxylesterase